MSVLTCWILSWVLSQLVEGYEGDYDKVIGTVMVEENDDDELTVEGTVAGLPADGEGELIILEHNNCKNKKKNLRTTPTVVRSKYI